MQSLAFRYLSIVMPYISEIYAEQRDTESKKKNTIKESLFESYSTNHI